MTQDQFNKMVGEVWQAFNTLSDAQELVGMGDSEGPMSESTTPSGT